MKVFRQEEADGTLVKIIFQAEDESFDDLKAAVKVWETANGIVENWEGFFDCCESIQHERIVLAAPPA